MLEHVSYPDIDKTAYDSCVKASEHFRTYALSWYLDATAQEWDVLVLDDYRAVMPLPRRKKWGLTYVYTPPLVQQLGVFSSFGVTAEQESGFYRTASRKYLLMDYFAHSGSQAGSSKWIPRTNFILGLDRTYGLLTMGYNKNRRRIIGKGFGELRIDQGGDPNLLLSCMQDSVGEDEAGYAPGTEVLATLRRLIDSGNAALNAWNVFFEDQWVGGLLLLSDPFRITYLFPAATARGRKMQVGSLVLDALVREYQDTGLILDLEGSMIPGVADFYRSFGASEEVYYHFKSRLHGIF